MMPIRLARFKQGLANHAQKTSIDLGHFDQMKRNPQIHDSKRFPLREWLVFGHKKHDAFCG
jgi:hypothetical protein